MAQDYSPTGGGGCGGMFRIAASDFPCLVMLLRKCENREPNAKKTIGFFSQLPRKHAHILYADIFSCKKFYPEKKTIKLVFLLNKRRDNN